MREHEQHLKLESTIRGRKYRDLSFHFQSYFHTTSWPEPREFDRVVEIHLSATVLHTIVYN